MMRERMEKNRVKIVWTLRKHEIEERKSEQQNSDESLIYVSGEIDVG